MILSIIVQEYLLYVMIKSIKSMTVIAKKMCSEYIV